MNSPKETAAADEHYNADGYGTFMGLPCFIMKELACDVPDGVEIPIGERTKHDGKQYEVIWVEKKDYEIEGKHYNTLVRLRWIPLPPSP